MSRFWYILLIPAVLLTACKKDKGPELKAGFSYEFLSGDSANFVRFHDKSSGTYLLSEWNFGNGVTAKNKVSPVVYYPFAGDYRINLAIYSNSGSDSTAQTITVQDDDLTLDFKAEVADTNRNYVILTNTSGNLDQFTWHYRNKEVKNENQVVAYFPFNGRFDITLEGSLHGVQATKTRQVTISGDDPHYVNSFKLVWSDEFDGPDVNRNWWNFETGATGWGNQELQNYTDGSNAIIENGILKLTAKKVNDNKEPGSYTSTRITTKNKKEFKYGRIEFRAKLPSGTGIWPALWLLGSNIGSVGWPACGEIDVMEYVGYDPNTVHTTIHTPSSYGSSVNTSVVNLPDCEEAFHTYGMIWTERYMKFYIDNVDNIFYTYAPPIKNDRNWPFNQPLFLIMNVAVGGTWGGSMGIDNSIFPQTMEIDYVRVYQPEE